MALNIRRSHPCCAMSSKPCFLHHPSFAHLDLKLHPLVLPHAHRPELQINVPTILIALFPYSWQSQVGTPCLQSPDSFWLTFLVPEMQSLWWAVGWEHLPHTGTNFCCLLIGTHCLCKSFYSHPIHTPAHFISIHITLWPILVLWQPYLRPDSPAHISGLLIESKTWVVYKMYF